MLAGIVAGPDGVIADLITRPGSCRASSDGVSFPTRTRSSLKKNTSAKPFFLSGGIGLANTKALKDFFSSSEAVNCHAIDVNSKFEEEPGLKKIEELEKFMVELGIGSPTN